MYSHKRRPVIVIQGGQWGSEAKGACAAYLCLTQDVGITVRTGAINAGHTVVYGGKRYAMQQIPVGWVNPNTKLVIGAGAYIHPDTLWREIDMINAAMPGKDVRERLFVDYRCSIHNEAAEQASKDANRHHRIGATGKGCSEAIVAKIRDRNNGYELFANTQQGRTFRDHNMGKFIDTVEYLNNAIDMGELVLIEGTQGTMLDLHIGPYPFTTSRMTSAANWIAECGLSPALEYEVVLVVRTFPIRVAGNSGPMADEIEWLRLAGDINRKLLNAGLENKVNPFAMAEFEMNLIEAATQAVGAGRYSVPTDNGRMHISMSTWTDYERSLFRIAASELHRDALNLCTTGTLVELKKLFEMTTVTKKLRRIAKLNVPDLKYAIAINRPKWVCLTFLDYVVPQLASTTTDAVDSEDVPWMRNAKVQALDYARDLEKKTGVDIRLVGTGPGSDNMFPTSHLEVGSER